MEYFLGRQPVGTDLPQRPYLFGRIEWEHWSREDHGLGDMPASIAELVSLDAAITDFVPVVDAGLLQLVEVEHHLTEEVSLRATPGHATRKQIVATVQDAFDQLDRYRHAVAGDQTGPRLEQAIRAVERLRTGSWLTSDHLSYLGGTAEKDDFRMSLDRLLRTDLRDAG